MLNWSLWKICIFNSYMDKIEDNIDELLEWKIIQINDEKIYLNERVWGKI